MRQVVLLCAMPVQLRHADAHAWLLETLSTVAGLNEVRDTRLVALGHSALVARAWPWMVTMDIAERADLDALLGRGPLADLIGDLRLVGMRPEILIVPCESERVSP